MAIQRAEARDSVALRRAVVGFSFVLAGCATGIGGGGSFPLVTRAKLGGYERIADIDETRCTHRLLVLFSWGDDTNHEAIVTDALAAHEGDALVEAELTYHLIPTLVYDRYCARVTGTVARHVSPSSKAGDASAQKRSEEPPDAAEGGQ